MQDILTGAPSLLAGLFLSLDGRDYEALAACFTPDGAWTRQGKTLHGHDDIKAALVTGRPATLTTIHVLTNVSIDSQTADRAQVRFYLTVYRHDASAPPPYPVPKPAVVGLCKAEFGQARGQWLIAQLHTGPYVFAN